MEILEVREAINVECLLSKAIELKRGLPSREATWDTGRKATEAGLPKTFRNYLATNASDKGHGTTTFNICPAEFLSCFGRTFSCSSPVLSVWDICLVPICILKICHSFRFYRGSSESLP